MPAPISSPSPDGSVRRPAIPTDCCWTVPLIAACANFLFSIPHTNSGLFYVLFMDKFGVNREAVSWPRTISTVLSNLMGFVIGAFQHRVSIYNMMVFGAVLCPAAIMASAFVPSVQWMMLTFGFFYGISEGTLMITTSVYMVSYFNKYRSAAMGLKFLGLSISGTFGPLLLSALEEKYGLEGMFLVLSGLTLNVLPLAVLLRDPSPMKLPLQNFCKKPARIEEQPTTPAICFKERTRIHRLHKATKKQRLPQDQRTSSPYAITESTTATKESLGSPQVTSRSTGLNPEVLNAQDDQENVSNIFRQTANILKAPVFYTLLVPFIAGEFTLPLFASTIVDYAGDKKVSKGAAAVLVSCLCFGGFCGRLVVPVISDRVPHGRCVVACVSYVVLSVCFMLMPHLYSFPAIAAVAVVAGIQQGYLATIKAVLTADYLGVQSVPVCWGLVAAVSLPLTFCEPSIVGLFRDTGGSYDNLYRMCGAIDIMPAFLLAAKVCIDARRSNKARIS